PGAASNSYQAYVGIHRTVNCGEIDVRTTGTLRVGRGSRGQGARIVGADRLVVRPIFQGVLPERIETVQSGGLGTRNRGDQNERNGEHYPRCRLQSSPQGGTSDDPHCNAGQSQPRRLGDLGTGKGQGSSGGGPQIIPPDGVVGS